MLLGHAPCFVYCTLIHSSQLTRIFFRCVPNVVTVSYLWGAQLEESLAGFCCVKRRAPLGFTLRLPDICFSLLTSTLLKRTLSRHQSVDEHSVKRTLSRPGHWPGPFSVDELSVKENALQTWTNPGFLSVD